MMILLLLLRLLLLPITAAAAAATTPTNSYYYINKQREREKRKEEKKTRNVPLMKVKSSTALIFDRLSSRKPETQAVFSKPLRSLGAPSAPPKNGVCNRWLCLAERTLSGRQWAPPFIYVLGRHAWLKAHYAGRRFLGGLW